MKIGEKYSMMKKIDEIWKEVIDLNSKLQRKLYEIDKIIQREKKKTSLKKGK